jgi:POT family proton-dependent oligopeptide transporter
LADHILGQSRAVWWGSILVALGHLAIGLSALWGASSFFVGLGLIVLGTGLFKTCISVLVGRLYTDDDSRRDGGFSIFYMGINIGAFVAPLITGWLVDDFGWHWGFGAGGVGMLIALLIYRIFAKTIFDQLTHTPTTLARRQLLQVVVSTVVICGLLALVLVNVDPIRLATVMTSLIVLLIVAYFAFLLLAQGLTRLEQKKLILAAILFVAATIFWSANEQQPTALNLFAQDFIARDMGSWSIPVVWFQSINPIAIIIGAPLMSLLWQRWPNADLSNYLGKFALGLLMVAASFGLMYVAAQQIVDGQTHVAASYLIVTYVLQAIGELCISPVGLAAMTLLAPARLQGQMMGIWLVSLSLGNLFAGLVGGQVNPEQVAEMPMLFGRTAIALLLAAIGLLLLAPWLKRWLNESPTTTNTTL